MIYFDSTQSLVLIWLSRTQVSDCDDGHRERCEFDEGYGWGWEERSGPGSLTAPKQYNVGGNPLHEAAHTRISKITGGRNGR